MHDHEWRHARKVAAELAGSVPQDNKLLGKAHKAAKRVRENGAF